jgi:hypothetical protein
LFEIVIACRSKGGASGPWKAGAVPITWTVFAPNRRAMGSRGNDPGAREDALQPRGKRPNQPASGTAACGNAHQGGRMKIGIIDSGAIDSAFAGHVVRAGHDVLLSNKRGIDAPSELLRKRGPGTRSFARRSARRDRGGAGPPHGYGSFQ